mmetsp:Transcript_30771/g.70569  ORF Transcript_30771/g.70569 Transcript_30771/m.70569 type:complete len:178 (-) Transcript_30771:34-567(-)
MEGEGNKTSANAANAGKDGPREPPKKKAKKKATAEEAEARVIRFRNYQPRSQELQKFCLPRVTSAEIEAAIDKEVEEALAAAEEQDGMLNIAPKKPNWDLKRDVQRKMTVLEARTDRAIVQLIRQRIKQDKAETKAGGNGNVEDENGGRDEASITLAREVMKRSLDGRKADSDSPSA